MQSKCAPNREIRVNLVYDRGREVNAFFNEHRLQIGATTVKRGFAIRAENIRNFDGKGLFYPVDISVDETANSIKLHYADILRLIDSEIGAFLCENTTGSRAKYIKHYATAFDTIKALSMTDSDGFHAFVLDGFSTRHIKRESQQLLMFALTRFMRPKLAHQVAFNLNKWHSIELVAHRGSTIKEVFEDLHINFPGA